MATEKSKSTRKVKSNARQARLEEAMRKNLIKRKQQARKRDQKE